jgi:predicted kinase
VSRRPKLIILNGFAGSGKSTIAGRYIAEHPLAINIEGDQIIAMLGQWKEHYDKARECVLPHTKAMTETHLKLGYDVVVPYLLVNHKDAEEFEEVAHECDADFYEIMLFIEKARAIERLLKRGRWGEEGLPKITEKDLPEIVDLFNKMEKATSKRPNTIFIEVKVGDVDNTYESVHRLL